MKQKFKFKEEMAEGRKTAKYKRALMTQAAALIGGLTDNRPNEHYFFHDIPFDATEHVIRFVRRRRLNNVL